MGASHPELPNFHLTRSARSDMVIVGVTPATGPRYGYTFVKPLLEKRRENRMLCSEFAEITFADQKGESICDIGLLEDVCPAGVTISLSVPIPLGKKVRIHTKGFEADAFVRHCELGDYGFLVGMEFADGYEWDQRKWSPGHLLALPAEED